MPADYQSTAQALALSPSRSPSPPPQQRPPWSSGSPSRRLTNPRIRSSSLTSSSNSSFLQRISASAQLLGEQMIKVFLRLTPLQRLLVGVGLVVTGVLGILALVYSHRFFAWLATIRETWRALPGGWLIIFALVFLSSIPPLIGYSTVATMSGFVYGFPLGWPIIAVGCTAGALCAFLAGRTVLSKYVDRMVGHDHRFIALGQVLRQEGIWYLTAIRFCPLPFSLSNGFLATIPSITPLAFTISTALSSPKLLVHVFIGSRLALLAEDGDKMSAGSKAINYLSMILGAALGITVGLIIYRRTMARAAELAQDDSLAAEAEAGNAGFVNYEDAEGEDNRALMDPDDAAVLMSDDDISLWEQQDGHYHDDDDNEDSGDDDDNEDSGDDGRKSSDRKTSGDGI